MGCYFPVEGALAQAPHVRVSIPLPTAAVTGTENRAMTSETPRRDLKSLLAEYGGTALGIYLAIFAVALVGFWFAIRLGWRPESAAGQAGTWAAAYVATKITQPLRIVATLVLTPIAAKIVSKTRRPR